MARTRTLKPKSILLDISGRPEGVVLSMHEYRRIAELLEDVADVTWMKAHAGEEKFAVPWEHVKQRLRKTGVV